MPEDFDDLLFGAAAQLEDQEGVLVEALGQEVVDGGDMLAGIGPVGAGAIGLKLPGGGGEKGEMHGGKGLLDIGGHFAREEFCRKYRLVSHGVRDLVPILI